MKRNLFPLLGIAFVVAIAATGIFYGLFVGKMQGASSSPAAGAGAQSFVVAARALERGAVVSPADVRLEPVKAEGQPNNVFYRVEDVAGRTLALPIALNEPFTTTNLSTAGSLGALRIPKGMRAISIRAFDSTGLLPFVRAGQRADVQGIFGNPADAVVRTLLNDVEILNVHAEAAPAPNQANPVAILNILVPAKDIDKVALADSSAKVRIVLRNGEDREDPATAAAKQRTSAAAGSWQPAGLTGKADVQFAVSMAAAPVDSLRAIPGASQSGALEFGIVSKDWKGSADTTILASENLQSAFWQEVHARPSTLRNGYDLRLALTPRGSVNGRLRLRLKPEYSLPLRGGISSRRFTADLDIDEGQSVLVRGFEQDAAAPGLLEVLFRSPQSSAGAKELLMVVTPRLLASR